MAKILNLGYADTPIDGVTGLTFDRGLLNFKEDFVVTSNNSGKEVRLTNRRAEVTQPEDIRIASSPIANIYAGTGLEAGVFAPTKAGLNILFQLTEVWMVTDDTDPSYQIALPVSIHTVVKVPKSEFVTSARIFAAQGRLLSSMFDTGSTSTGRLDAILRGSLVPSEV